MNTKIAYLVDGFQEKIHVVREVRSAGGEEQSERLPSVLDRAFKGEL